VKKSLVDTRFLALDVLRLVLAFWVLYHHLAGTSFAFRTSHESGILEWISFALYKTGNFAPQAFFVISGFVISGYLNEKRDNFRKFSHFYWHFIRTRFLSLYPLYLLSLIAIFVNSNEDREYFLWQLFGLGAFNRNYCVLNCPSWSLSAEFFFYLLAPLLCVILDRMQLIQQKILFAGILVIQCGISIVIQLNSSLENAWYFLYHYPPYLFLSFMVGFVCFNIGFHNLFSKIRFTPTLRFLGLFAIWITYIIFFVKYPRFLTTATFTIIPATLSLLFVGMSVEDKRSSSVPDQLSIVVSKVGRATYPIYILQWTYIGALRLVFNVESIWLFNILFVIFSIPITFLFRRIDALFRSLFILNAKNRKKSITVSKLGFITIIIFFITAMYPNEYTSTNFAPNSKLATKIESISITTSPEETQMIDLTLAVSNSSESGVTATFCMIFMENLGSTMTKFEIKGLIPPRAQGTITRTLEITKDVKLSSNPERWNARCF
jgi:peptidoglycan/LPS O-acetylase OafA/YrhL